ncbi:hypothetical protein Pcinc_012907 [Petrolisthes cinctipes]|uniref:3'-5' exonuclease domain-containing protein n=1 Tax=Petrolisthes cinctipes TaxID=88211 RepID=A0AAE1FY36_PETCI|nr:hypothetical protein Pcinc_012907 [Petrolisthes cinctipes]
MVWEAPNQRALLVAGGVTAGLGACVGLYLGRRRVGTAVRAAHAKRLMQDITTSSKTIHVVKNAEKWQAVLPILYKEARKEGAVGLDCEWVQAGRQRRAVAILQLASFSGTCVLVRLPNLAPNFPPSLAEFLEDESILKVGVGSIEDSNYLTSDYGLKVRGCVDLRHLAQMCPGQDGRLGLSGLAEHYLNITMDKDWRIRASDWEAGKLTPRQRQYAAEDALVGIKLLVSIVAHLCVVNERSQVSTPSSMFLSLLLPTPLWHSHLSSLLRNAALPFLNLKFSSKSQQGVVAVTQPAPALKTSQVREAPKRKSPLYHNCQLLAPDNHPLCTLDPKKARWYVDKGLGVLVSEEPLVVRLKFEPAGRPQAESGDGAFYLQSRLNVCVVCGCQDSYTRKSIVPHEYRRHFHRLLKHHQNHDVVLLCFPCHRVSNMVDNTLRVQLGEEFGAPVSTDPRAKASIDGPRKAVRDAARALMKPPGTIPSPLHDKFLKTLQEFYPGQDVTTALLIEAANLEVKVYREGHVTHGLGIYQAYAKIGLNKLEQQWRQHFLDTMKPRFMPECWSVSHNSYKLQLKMARLPLDHPDRLVYKMALVGTEGTIDVPYDPNVGRNVPPSSSSMPHPSRDSTPEDSSSGLGTYDDTKDTSVISDSPPLMLSGENSDECDLIDDDDENDDDNDRTNMPGHGHMIIESCNKNKMTNKQDDDT